jgi:ribonuclease P protein component
MRTGARRWSGACRRSFSSRSLPPDSAVRASAVGLPQFKFPQYEFPQFEFPQYEFPQFKFPQYEFPQYELSPDLTRSRDVAYTSNLCWPEFQTPESDHGNANIPPAQSEAEEQARVSGAYGDEGGSQDPEPSPSAWSQAPGRNRRQETVGRCVVAATSHPGGRGRRLPRAQRITRSAEIREVFRRGKRSGTAHLDVYDSASLSSYPRVGVVVPKHRHSVVERNLVKRRLREVLRLEVLPRLASAGIAADVLVRARREAYTASYGVLRDELVGWTERRCSRVSSS